MGEGDKIFNVSALTRKLKTIEPSIKSGETETEFLCTVNRLLLQLLATRKQPSFQFIQNLLTRVWRGQREVSRQTEGSRGPLLTLQS